MSMRLRLILSFVLVVLVAITTVAVIARQNTAREVSAFMFRGGMSSTGGIAGQLEAYYQQYGSWEGVESLLTNAHGRWGAGGQGMGSGMMMGQRLRLADADGIILADSSGAAPTGSLSRAERQSAVSLQVGGKIVGYLVAEGGMGYTPSDETFLLGRVTQAALTAGLIAGGLALLLALFLAYRLLRPINELRHAAERLGQGDLNQRVPLYGDDELASLGRTFNHMAASLQRAEESRRAMTADIAHELRNPLAVQRANLEAMQDGVYPLTPENLQPVLEQNLLLTRMVDDLRTLALAESGQLQLERIPTDLGALVNRLVDRFRPQAAQQNVELVYAPNQAQTAAPLLLLDAQRIEQIMNNLLSNALRHTPNGGRIHLQMQQLPQRVELTVHDSGPGIPAEALPQIFERFYRADRSRSRSEGGSGLGLAIARQLAEAHGGALSAANHSQGGAVLTLSLPIAESKA